MPLLLCLSAGQTERQRGIVLLVLFLIEEVNASPAVMQNGLNNDLVNSYLATPSPSLPSYLRADQNFIREDTMARPVCRGCDGPVATQVHTLSLNCIISSSFKSFIYGFGCLQNER